MKQRTSRLVVFLASAILVLAVSAGCAGAPPTPTPTSAPAAPTKAPAAPTQAPAATKAPAAPTPAPAAESKAPAPAPAKTFTVGISQLMPHPVLDEFRSGFIEGLKEEGFAEGKNLKIDYQNSQGDISMAKTIADKFVADKVDLIFTITTPSSLAAAKATTSIPVIFGFVTDPVAAGIVPKLEKPGGNITGLHVMQPVDKQMESVKEIVPNLKNLGTVYNPGEANSRVLVGQMKQHGERLGYKVVEATATASAEVATAARSLVGRVDAIYIPGDNTAQTALGAVVKVGEDNKLPVLTSDLRSLKLGAISAYSYEEIEVGKETAKVAARVLKGEKPGDIIIEGPKKFILAINPDAAGRMGVKLSDDVLKKGKVIK